MERQIRGQKNKTQSLLRQKNENQGVSFRAQVPDVRTIGVRHVRMACVGERGGRDLMHLYQACENGQNKCDIQSSTI